MGTSTLWIPTGERGRSSDWVVAMDMGGRISCSTRGDVGDRWDRSDGGFDNGESISDRGWGRDRSSWYSGGDQGDRWGEDEVWVVRAGHDIEFERDDGGKEEKRVREKRQWGVAFYNHSKQTLYFWDPFWDSRVFFGQVSFLSDQEGPSEWGAFVA